MPHTGLSFFYNGISFSYLIQTRNFTDGTRVGETKIHLIFLIISELTLKRRFVNDKTEDILMTSSEGDSIRAVFVRIKGSNAYSYYFKDLISEKLCWSTYYADHVEHCVA